VNILHIAVNNKIAAYSKRDGYIVCGNSDYKVKFTFDEEWAEHEEKTARFIWNGQYFDVVFTGDTCDVPVITNADSVLIGVYAGDLRTTTSASIGCKRSVLCGGEKPNPGTGQHYTNEAKAAAEEAKALVELALCELDPLLVREAGTYAIKAVRETDDARSNIFVYSNTKDGFDPALEYRLHDIPWGPTEGTEKIFSFEVTDEQCQYGLTIICEGCSCTLYESRSTALEELRSEMEAALGSYITDIDTLLGGE